MKDSKENIVRMDAILPLTAEDKASLRALAERPDSEIDLSDIPELTDEQLSRMVRANPLYKPTKTSTNIRLDSDVLAWPG